MAEECANPLLAQFLKEWWDVAKERNSKGATTCVREATVIRNTLMLSKIQASLRVDDSLPVDLLPSR